MILQSTLIYIRIQNDYGLHFYAPGAILVPGVREFWNFNRLKQELIIFQTPLVQSKTIFPGSNYEHSNWT